MKCKYCKIKLPDKVKTDVEISVWMGYHIKSVHPKEIRRLAKAGKRWKDAVISEVNNE